MLKDKILGLAQKRWHTRLKKHHHELWDYTGDTSKLRLLLGPGRSGTTWAMNVLSYTRTPVRVVVEPLFPFKLKVWFSLTNDRVAHPYSREIDRNHIARRIFEILTFPQYTWSKLLADTVIMKNDPGFEYVIIKEVHTLLITEALLERLCCKASFILRDPLRVVDSQLAYTGFRSKIWHNEYRYIADNRFLSDYFPREAESILREMDAIRRINDRRKKEIQQKILTIAVLNRMLQRIAQRCDSVMLIRYEELCTNPVTIFSQLADFFDLKWDEKSTAMLEKTMRQGEEKYDPNSIYRDTSKQLDKEFRHLTQEDRDRAVAILERCGLNLYP